MSKSAPPDPGQPASDLLEEAVRLLRRAPLSILLTYFIGAVPGVLAALYFLADVSGSADAETRVLPASVALTAAYLWMKCWQAVFTARLRSELLLQEPLAWGAGRVAGLVVGQIALQPTGLVLRPIALALTLPYVWAATFYQNLTVLGDGTPGGLRNLWQQAFAQCRLWPKQAHVAATLLTIFGFFVWVNLLIAMLAGPFLLKMFFGVETMFTKHVFGMFNLTFFAASFAGTYLCLDPIRKAMNVLRCFRGSSLRSGADLVVQLRTVRRASTRGVAAALALALAATLLISPLARAAMKEEPKVKSAELSRSLDDVLARRDYAWRAPRERREKTRNPDGWFEQMRKNLEQWIARVSWKFGHWLGRIIEHVRDWFAGDREPGSGHGNWFSLLGSVRVVFYLLLVVAAGLLIVLVARHRRRPRALPAAAEPLAPRPDLREENVTADQLPEEGWLQLARDLMQSGELRLALRASYLASLAHLGHREFIRLAKHKSNRDYDRELRRRARAQPELLSAFGENLTAFERAWYGEHAVTSASLGDFTARLEKIRTC